MYHDMCMVSLKASKDSFIFTELYTKFIQFLLFTVSLQNVINSKLKTRYIWERAFSVANTDISKLTKKHWFIQVRCYRYSVGATNIFQNSL